MTTTAEPGQLTLLTDVLRRRAVEQPDRTAYTFLDDEGAETGSVCYRELYARSMAVAERLRSCCAPGDRALLVFPQSVDFIVAYFGCLYAHVLAVPVNPPRRNQVQDATRSIVTDCRAAAVLTVRSMSGVLRQALEPLCPTAQWLDVDEIGAEVRPDAVSAPIDPDAVAFLQYTSGSTAAPKGVRVTHRNVAANQEMIRLAFGHDHNSTVVGWAPFFHDQGLIGNVLQPIHVGARAILMSPAAFIRRPLLWLSTISRYRAHTSGGPNFAFDACVARAVGGKVPTDLDLSSWRVAFDGAEPIRAETLYRFAAVFAPHGFDARALYPCYGQAEATLLVTGSAKGRGPRTADVDAEALAQRRWAPAGGGRTRTLVGSGRVLPGQHLRIVDPDTGAPCPPDRAGEIWVSGDHVAQGYWERPTQTEQTFGARCADRPERTYLRTGDLGVLADGELYVVGRLKDLIIIRGRNIYPQDIENTVQGAHPALRAGRCAAFAVPADAADPDAVAKLVVVQEMRRDPHLDADPAEVAGCVRAAVLAEHELAIGDLVLARAEQLRKTSSGKIMRTAARQQYLDGGFALWSPRPAAAPEPTDDNGGTVATQTWPVQNPDYAELVPAVVLSMPAAKHLGFDFARIAPGEADIVQPHRAELTQHDGFFQGGVLGSLADFAAGSAAGTLLPPGWANMTIDYTVKIVAPAKGSRVVARGRVIKPGALLTIAAAEVYSVDDDNETLCATALVTLRNIKLAQS
ncbi:AMP-binding protein [Nocardia sp. alder85J]|uniref:AMP-binding protein n=1 Tax=Nocardia sp. alder85J TaxID=2862949 RepID=UPI001CD24CA1|nr:AMP-binding protein [Nocardia sp. alder85J]MCX4091565.1 AMP-binding protein [Nocardia sp. alder85J]